MTWRLFRRNEGRTDRGTPRGPGEVRRATAIVRVSRRAARCWNDGEVVTVDEGFLWAYTCSVLVVHTCGSTAPPCPISPLQLPVMHLDSLVSLGSNPGAAASSIAVTVPDLRIDYYSTAVEPIEALWGGGWGTRFRSLAPSCGSCAVSISRTTTMEPRRAPSLLAAAFAFVHVRRHMELSSPDSAAVCGSPSVTGEREICCRAHSGLTRRHRCHP